MIPLHALELSHSVKAPSFLQGIQPNLPGEDAQVTSRLQGPWAGESLSPWRDIYPTINKE